MKRILLVADEPEIPEGLALILKPIPDVCLHSACLASHALQHLQQSPVSLVVADIRMPGRKYGSSMGADSAPFPGLQGDKAALF